MKIEEVCASKTLANTRLESFITQKATNCTITAEEISILILKYLSY
jgi:hypothetical protein